MLTGSKNARQVIDNFSCCPSEDNMKKLVIYTQETDFDDKEILYLANKLANSGRKIEKNKDFQTCDIPSTGGPSSLSTLISPLFLKIMGNYVLKLGVPGRPAGGIDVLAQIPGYNVNPDQKQLNEWLKRSSYVHFLANKNYAPLDAILFQYRRRTNSVDILSLAIASLLSKKIAVGIDFVGLDIRVSSFGNFGKSWSVARQNATRFNKIAGLAGIQSTCFLTNCNIPQQPYIGRGEAILALHKMFSNEFDSCLEKHIKVCYEMSNSISKNKNSYRYDFNTLRDAFYENIELQGGSISSFTQIAKTIEKDHKYKILAHQKGLLSIDLEHIRRSIFEIQSKCLGNFPDNCGIVLKADSNKFVNKGDDICSFRCEESYKEVLEENLKESFTITSHNLKEMKSEEIKFEEIK
jgi:pyrimidine-nucleoside phosphorylase